MYITIEDLGTHLYAEAIASITRSNDDIATEAIATAIAEAKMYLKGYNLTALFGTDTLPPTIADPHLKTLIKSMVCYRLLLLCNATGVPINTYKEAYEKAVDTLKNIRDGKAVPEGWLPADTDNAGSVAWNSQPKRQNYF